MIHIAVVEDDDKYASKMLEFLNQYRKESREAINAVRFVDGDEIAEDYRPCFDIILIDIAMRFTDSLTAARQIRRLDAEADIVFITNTAQYAMQGYDSGDV